MKRIFPILVIWLSTVIISGCSSISSTGAIPFGMDNNAAVAKLTEVQAITTVPPKYSPSFFGMGKNFDIYQKDGLDYGLMRGIDDLNNYLNNLLDKVIVASGVQGYDGRIYVTADPHPVPPEASAEGNIFIPFGFLRIIENEDSLVFVIAHEFAHHAYGHFSSEAIGQGQKVVKSIMKNLNRYAQQAQSMLNDAGISATPAKLTDIQRLAYYSEKTDDYLMPLWQGFQEDQADQLAIDLLIKLGYSFEGGLMWIDPFLKEQKLAMEREAKQAELRRLSAIEEAIKSLKANGNFIEAAKAQALKMAGDVGDSMLRELQNSYGTFEEREAELISYYERFHLDYQDPVPKASSWKKVWNSGVNRTKLLNAINLTLEAEELAGKNDLDNARKKISKAIPALNGVSPAAQFVSFDLLLKDEKTTPERLSDQISKNLQWGGKVRKKADAKFLTANSKFKNQQIENYESFKQGNGKGNVQGKLPNQKADQPAGKSDKDFDVDLTKAPVPPNPLLLGERLPLLVTVKQELRKLSYSSNKSAPAVRMREVFRLYNEAPFLYPDMIEQERLFGDPLIAERLNLECAVIYPALAEACLESVQKGKQPSLLDIFGS